MSLDIAAAGSRVEAELGPQELVLLRAVPGLLATIEQRDDPAYDRLHPVAYADDEADQEFRRLAAPEIERARLADNQVFADVLDRLAEGPAVLTRAEAESCMRTVGAGRLTIAARHGMFDQDVFDAAQESPEGAIVAFLGWVQDEFVAALSELDES